MSDNLNPIDSLVCEIKSNTGFLDKLLFPRVSIVLGIVGLLIALVLIIK